MADSNGARLGGGLPWRADIKRARILWSSPTLWRRRGVFLIGAVAVGLVSIGFAYVADAAQDYYHRLFAWNAYALLLITPATFALFAYATKRWFDGAQGSGIPQAIAARRHHDGVLARKLLAPNVTVAKIVMTTLALAAGASIGREGPTVQIGACIMFMVGSYAGIGRQPGLILAGSAAGIAGAFNAPLAGVMFAIEEMAQSYDRRLSSLVVAAVVISGITTLLLVGDYNYFGSVDGTAKGWSLWLAVVLCALIGGAMGAVFSRLLVFLSMAPLNWLKWMRARPLLTGAVCGLVVAALAIATGGFAGGSAYAEAKLLLAGGTDQPWWYAPAKLVATVLSSASGIPGGLFSPSLSIGASLGANLGQLLPGGDVGAIALLGMAAYFAAVVQAPLTAFIIVLEMTDDAGMTVPLMAVTLLAAGLSRLITPEPLYHALSYGYDAKEEPSSRPEAKP
jgi:H+/Cl- antiporter ClcA